MEVHWFIDPHPTTSSLQHANFLRALDWPDGKVQTCIAGESGLVRTLRAMLHREWNIPREDSYISGYWKIELVEDEHQAMKLLESSALFKSCIGFD